MAPRIQYARSQDGTSLAFWTLGEGHPLVYVPPMPFSHVQLEWEFPEVRAWYERLARGRQLVRYDARGTGLSDRDVADFSIDAEVADIEAVVQRLGLERFDLFGSADAGMFAIAYAGRNPDRVAHLVLHTTWARRADVSKAPRTQALRALLDLDWETYRQTSSRAVLGWPSEDVAHRFAEFYGHCTTQEILQRALPQIYEYDVTRYLPEIRCPTLVLHRRGTQGVDVDMIARLASQIPDARLAVLEGNSPFPFMGDVPAMLAAIRDFLGGEAVEDEPALAEGTAPTAIMFTDLEASTEMTQRLGDEAAHQLLRRHDETIRRALRSHGGSEIKHTGDGIMASFPSVSRAVECAVAIQRDLTAYNAANPGSTIRVRVGLNAGEPIVEQRDLFGTAVQLARRICDQATPGQVLVSNVVRELVAGRGFTFSDLGEVSMKGFAEPVRVFSVGERID